MVASRKYIIFLPWIIGWCGFCLTGLVTADELVHRNKQQFEHWQRASESELESQRGGFLLPNGVSIDFSLERITSMNGVEVSSSFAQLPGNAFLFQNGALNQSPDLPGLGLGSVIQNNLDNQVIRNVTEINIAISQLKNLDLNTAGAVFNNSILPNTQ